MKVLDVHGFQTGTDEILQKLKSLYEQTEHIKQAVEKIISLEEELKGEGGEAIRSFYDEFHRTFLLSFQGFLKDYEKTIEETKRSLQAFESADRGFINETFLNHNIEHGLKTIQNSTTSLTNEANQAIDSVQDIVSLPRLHDDETLNGIEQARQRTRKTMEDLHEFDQQATKSLKNFEHKIDEMTTTVKEIGEMFQSGDTFQKMIDDLGLVTLLRNTGISFGAAIMNSGKLLRIGDLQFKMFRKDGKIFIKIKGENITNLLGYEKYRKLLEKNLGGKWKWNRALVTEMVNGGIPLYDKLAQKIFKKNSNKLINSQFDDLGNYVKRLDQPAMKVAGQTFKNEMKIWESFKGWKDASKLTKLGKGSGILGVGLTVYDDVVGNFYNEKTGKWEYTGGKQIKKFAVDTTVDLAAGAGAMAVGAAAGSLFLPPAGTVVGAVVGAGVFAVTNIKIPLLDPPQSLVEVTKNMANKAVDKVGDCIKDVGKTLNKIFW